MRPACAGLDRRRRWVGSGALTPSLRRFRASLLRRFRGSVDAAAAAAAPSFGRFFCFHFAPLGAFFMSGGGIGRCGANVRNLRRLWALSRPDGLFFRA